LWAILSLFFQHYLAALFASEVIIWASEGLLFWAVPANRLDLREAMRLSLLINLTSFAVGCCLPV
jgi:hypothetical protein